MIWLFKFNDIYPWIATVNRSNYWLQIRDITHKIQKRSSHNTISTPNKDMHNKWELALNGNVGFGLFVSIQTFILSTRPCHRLLRSSFHGCLGCPFMGYSGCPWVQGHPSMGLGLSCHALSISLRFRVVHPWVMCSPLKWCLRLLVSRQEALNDIF